MKTRKKFKLHYFLFLLLVLFLPTQLGRHFWPEWSYLMGLKIDYFSPTLYLSDILVFLIFIFWFLESFQFSLKNLNNKFLFLFLFLILNCFLAQNQKVAFYKLFKILEFILLGFYIIKNEKIIISQFPVFLIFLSIGLVYSSLIAIFQFFHQSSLGGIFWWLGERTFNVAMPGIAKVEINNRLFLRPYGTFSHPNALGGFLLVGLMLTFPFLFKKQKLLAFNYLFLIGGAIFLTFSRTIWLIGLGVAGYWSFKYFKANWLRNWSIGIFLLAGFLIARLSIFPSELFSSESFWQRWELVRISFYLFKKFPFLGVGLNNFIVWLPHFWKKPILWFQPVHNIYLLVLVETGLVGLGIFLFFLARTYQNLLKIRNQKLMFAFLIILLTGMSDHYWFTLQQNQLLLTIIFGLIWSKRSGRIN